MAKGADQLSLRCSSSASQQQALVVVIVRVRAAGRWRARRLASEQAGGRAGGREHQFASGGGELELAPAIFQAKRISCLEFHHDHWSSSMAELTSKRAGGGII